MGLLMKMPEKAYVRLFYQRPYALPFTMAVISMGYEEYFRKDVVLASNDGSGGFTEREVAEYIEEVTPSEVIFTVSNIINSIDTSKIDGLEQFI